jgi:succinoglycan biosynthesis transport protein ExoP
VNTESDSEFSLRDLLRVFNRRRRVLQGTALAVFLLAALACVIMTRRYEAKGVFALQKSSSDSLDLEGLMTGGGGGAADSLSVNIDMQTQVDILKSDTLTLQVIKELNLEQNADFRPKFNLMGTVLGLISPAGPKDPAGASLDNSPLRRNRALKTFAAQLSVKAIAGTRLIEVDFSNRDPNVAAEVVNHLIQALIDYTFQTRFNATNQISGWLESQLGDLRKHTEDLQAKVVALQQSSGIFGVGGTDLQGKPVVYSPVLDRLQQSSALLTQAEISRVVKESIYKIANTGNAELISQLSGTGIGGPSSQGLANSLSLIQSLRTQEATLNAQIGQDASQFGQNYPKLAEEQASLSSVENSLQKEINRVMMRAKNDYDIAVQTEDGARNIYNQDQAAAEKLNDKTIGYTLVSREAEQSDLLYQDLLKRLREAGILEGLHSSNLTIVDRASPPSRPNRPNVPVYLALGAFLGVFLGSGAALLTDAIDNKVQSTDEIEGMHLPLLGIVPEVKSSEMIGNPILMSAGDSAFGEAIRTLRTALMISRGGAPPQVLVVTSGTPEEGKSTVSLNLAAALAHYNKRVLLLEADMRRPVFKRRLHLNSVGGLSVLLSDQSGPPVEPNSLLEYPNLHILLAGPPPPYPSELLGSPALPPLINRWRQTYDFIVIDSPPILPVTDVQILMPFADSTVLVACAGKTTRVALHRSYKLLIPHVKDPARPSIGVLLNRVSTDSAAYYGYYGNYGYKSYYHPGGGENDKG